MLDAGYGMKIRYVSLNEECTRSELKEYPEARIQDQSMAAAAFITKIRSDYENLCN
jgi:hypothetical protein